MKKGKNRIKPVYPVNVCRECGHPIPTDDIAAVLSPRQRRVYEIVRLAGTAGISSKEIRDKVYENDPNGGPKETNIISVFAHYANVRLRPFGLEITARRGPWPLWRLTKREEIEVDQDGEVAQIE